MKTPSFRFSFSLFLILLFGAATATLLMRESSTSMTTPPASVEAITGEKNAAFAAMKDSNARRDGPLVAESVGALPAARKSAARTTGVAECDAFNGWTARYLAASGEDKKALVDEGISLATARRPAIAKLIPADPRR